MSPVLEKKQQLIGNQPKPETPGLSVGILSPLETLAQSIAGIAPSATPGILVPIVFGFAGALIMLLVVSVLGKQGFKVDWQQFEFARMNLENIRAGLVMAYRLHACGIASN